MWLGAALGGEACKKTGGRLHASVTVGLDILSALPTHSRMKQTMRNALKLPLALCALLCLAGSAMAAAPATADWTAEPAVILTPKPSPKPRINGAKVFGVRPGNPFLFTIAATGDRPMTFSAEGLPAGLQLDPQTGSITGSLKEKGEYVVTLRAKNALGAAERKLKIVCGPTDRADAGAGLEQLELLRQRGHRREGQGGGGRHGQERPDQPRLDLHQH